jgi:hypothetical protein
MRAVESIAAGWGVHIRRYLDRIYGSAALAENEGPRHCAAYGRADLRSRDILV